MFSLVSPVEDLLSLLFSPHFDPLHCVGGSGQFYQGSPYVVCVWVPVMVPTAPHHRSQTVDWLVFSCVTLQVLAVLYWLLLG